MVGDVLVSRTNGPIDTETRLVHTSYFDLEMYHYLAELGSSSKSP
jgi:hypothetical protein